MALTDAKHNKRRPKLPERKISNRDSGWYSDSVKLDAVKAWLLLGNMREVAALYNINYNTLAKWRYTDWWAQLVDEIKSENSIKLSGKLKKVAEKALTLTEERLENGDWVLNQKTGELIRKPVNLRDAHNVAVSLLKHADTVENKPIELESQKKTEETLTKLAAAFEKFAKERQPKKIEVTDVIFANQEEDAEQEIHRND